MNSQDPVVKRVLIQHHHGEREISGVVTYTEYLAQALRRCGVEARIVSTRQHSKSERIEAARWADVVHLNATDLPLAAYCLANGKKIILKYHYPFFRSTFNQHEDLPFLNRMRAEMAYNRPRPLTSPDAWKFFTGITSKLFLRLGLALAAHKLLACSDALTRACVLPRPVQTLYNPIQITAGDTPKTADDLRRPLRSIYAGRLDREKGVDLLLSASDRLRRAGCAFEVLVVGDGREAGRLLTESARLGLGDTVRFAGRIPHEEVLPLIRESIALVAPSRWEEPAGYIVQEAAAVQTLPIASRTGGLPEMGGPDALYFENEQAEDLAAAMRRCLEDPEAALRRGRAVYERACRIFAPDLIAEQFIGVCRGVLASK